MLFLALAAAVPLHFHFDASEFANTVYHVACLTDRVSCTKKIYARFWNEKYNVTREDGARFDEFAKIFEAVEKEAGPNPPAPLLPNYLGHFPSLRVRVRLIAAALDSKSPKEFRWRAATYAKPEQVERLAEIFEYAEKRLHPWWASTGQAIVQQKIKGVERQMTKLGVPQLAQQAAAFLEAKGSSRDLYVHAIPSPEFEGDAASATPALNHFCIEITHKFEADGMASIALHELTHSLYELSPDEKKLALMRQFADSTDPAARSLYAFMNEAMATAVQLLLMQREGQTDDDPYRDPFIPRLGKASLPLVRQAIENHTTLFNGFAEQYISAGRKALGQEADGLQFQFSYTAILGDSELKAAFLEQMPLHFFVYSEEERQRFPNLNVVRVLTFDEAARFASEIGGFEDKRGYRGFAYMRRSNQKPKELFLVGRDKAAMSDLAKRLAVWKEPAGEGLVFSIE